MVERNETVARFRHVESWAAGLRAVKQSPASVAWSPERWG